MRARKQNYRKVPYETPKSPIFFTISNSLPELVFQQKDAIFFRFTVVFVRAVFQEIVKDLLRLRRNLTGGDGVFDHLFDSSNALFTAGIGCRSDALDELELFPW